MTAPGAVVDVLTVRGGAVGTEASAVAWADAVDAAVLLMQADDGPDAVVVGEVGPSDALTIAASDSQPPPGVLVVRPGVIREARDA